MSILVEAIVKKCEKGDSKPGRNWCLAGDTKVFLLDGRLLSIKEIFEKFKNSFFWVYSCRKDGQIVPGKAYNPKLTRKNVKVIRIFLDNNKYIDCTFDHLIMLRNGEYVEAKNLKSGDSLMPLYIFKNLNYVMVKNNRTGMSNYVHRLVVKTLGHKIKKDNIVHHKNFVRSDNRPENLAIMDKDSHYKFHSSLRKGIPSERKGKTYEEVYGQERANEQKIIRRKSGIEYWNKQSKDDRKIRGQLIKNGFTLESRSKLSQKAKNQHTSLTDEQKLAISRKISESVKKIAKRGYLNPSKRLDVRKKISIARKKYWASLSPEKKTSPLKGKTYEEIHGQEQSAIIRQKKSESAKRYYSNLSNNHKVLKVESLESVVDVYNFEVEYYNNFAIEAGIFVHNCVYKPTSEGSGKIKRPQPKGWPKTYKTEDKAKRGVKMMKTFGEYITKGWYMETFLPIMYSIYKKDPDIFDNKDLLLANIEDSKVKVFLENYIDEIETARYWSSEFDKVKKSIDSLRKVSFKIKKYNFKSEAQTVINICSQALKKASFIILEKYFSKNKIATAHPKLFICPKKGSVLDITRDFRTAPNSSLPNPSNDMNEINFLCPKCQFRLLEHLQRCPFCGVNPVENLQNVNDNQKAIVDLLKDYVGRDENI